MVFGDSPFITGQSGGSLLLRQKHSQPHIEVKYILHKGFGFELVKFGLDDECGVKPGRDRDERHGNRGYHPEIQGQTERPGAG